MRISSKVGRPSGRNFSYSKCFYACFFFPYEPKLSMRFNLYFCAVNNPNVLKWNERLIIVVDAAQGIQSTFILNYGSLCFLFHFTLILFSMVSYGFSGLDYLHNGYKPPLIHRFEAFQHITRSKHACQDCWFWSI